MKRPQPRVYLRRRRYIKPRLARFSSQAGKKKLAIITGQLAAGGVEQVLLNIISGLPESLFDITIYITDFNKNTWIDRFSKRCRVIDFNDDKEWAEDEGLVDDFVATSIKANKFDVVFITNSLVGYKVLPKIALHKKLTRRKMRIYDLLHTHGTPEENDSFLRLSLPFDKYIDKRIVISQYLKDYYMDKYSIDSNRILVIHNGLPIAKRNNSPGANPDAKTLGKTGKKPISYIGRLQKDKSPERLVEVAYELQNELQAHNSFIAVFGDGELRSQLEDRCKQLDILNKSIVFYGQTNRPLSVMAASYFTILTSDLEGLPMSVIESMSTGTPAIAPDVGGVPEIIANNAGILIKFRRCKNERDKMLNLKQGIVGALKLEQSDYEAMRDRAKNVIEENFSNMEDDYRHLFIEGKIS